MNQNLKQFKLFKFITFFLPGIFLIGFNIGTGSVTAMAKAGADYGMSLLWTIIISCLCTFFMINLYGKYTLITGETALQAFRKHIHPAVSYFFIIALTFGVCGSVMGVMGIVSEISYEWSKTFIRDGISPIYFSILYISMVYFIFWNGNTQIFERSAALIVAIMAEIVRRVPHWPNDVGGIEKWDAQLGRKILMDFIVHVHRCRIPPIFRRTRRL